MSLTEGVEKCGHVFILYRVDLGCYLPKSLVIVFKLLNVNSTEPIVGR